MAGFPTAPLREPCVFLHEPGGRVAGQKILKERQKEDRLLKNT
jgi:hypothetical protein